VNTAEAIAGELCGTAAFLGIAIGYPWLWLHYAAAGVLKLSRPPQPKAPPVTTNSVADAADEAPASATGQKPTMREVA
jgi:hypothetical protein